MAVGRGKPSNTVVEAVAEAVAEAVSELLEPVTKPVPEVVVEPIVEPIVEPSKVVTTVAVKEVQSNIPYSNHEYHNISNAYLMYLKEKIRISLFGIVEDSIKERHTAFLEAANAIMDYRLSNGIVIK
jgi:hypothetical protein